MYVVDVLMHPVEDRSCRIDVVASSELLYKSIGHPVSFTAVVGCLCFLFDPCDRFLFRDGLLLDLFLRRGLFGNGNSRDFSCLVAGIVCCCIDYLVCAGNVFIEFARINADGDVL